MINEIIFILQGLPNWKLMLFFISFFCLMGLSGLLLFRTRVYPTLHLSAETNEGVNFFAQVVGVLFGILMGLVAVSCWTSFSDLDELISDEVSSIASFYRITSGLETEDTRLIQDKTLEYLNYIPNSAWQGYTSGNVQEEVPYFFTEIRSILFKVNVTGFNQQAIYRLALSDLERMIHCRRLRINAFINSGIPNVFWMVLLAGGTLSITMTYFVYFESHVIHASLVAIYCISLGIVFFLIAALDNPYRGDVRVRTEPYSNLLKALQSERA